MVALSLADAIAWGLIFVLTGACISVGVELCYHAFMDLREQRRIGRDE